MVENRKKPAAKVEYATQSYVEGVEKSNRDMCDLMADRVDGLWKSIRLIEYRIGEMEASFEDRLFATQLMLAVVGIAVIVIAGIMPFGGRQ